MITTPTLNLKQNRLICELPGLKEPATLTLEVFHQWPVAGKSPICVVSHTKAECTIKPHVKPAHAIALVYFQEQWHLMDHYRKPRRLDYFSRRELTKDATGIQLGKI
jgi:hypothetical protein